MAKRKQFSLEPAERREEGGGEIERLFNSELRAAERPVLRDLPINRIQANPFQARQNFDNLDELINSIRTQGFVSRLRVRPHPDDPDQFQLVYGERRLRAATAAGLSSVPVEIAAHSDEQLIEIGLAENIQRQDLDPLEEAYAFKTFITQRGYTQQRLADRIGKDVSYVIERLHVLEDTPPDVQDMVRRRADTLRSAREIAKLPDATTRAPLIADVLDRRLSTRAVRERVREHLDQQVQAMPAVPQSVRPEYEQALLSESDDVPRSVSNPQQRNQPQAAGASAPGVSRNVSEHAMTIDRNVSEHAMTIDRDIRNVRAIFARWQRQMHTLEEPYLSRLIEFMTDEHLPQVDQLVQAMEQRK